jgi:hypothetical protein
MSDRTHSTTHRIVVDEIRDTGPIDMRDLVHRLDGSVPRRDVLRQVADAETTGEIRLDMLGRHRANQEEPARRS